MADPAQNENFFQELEYYSPNFEYAVRQVQIGPDNHFGKIEIVDVKQRKVLFALDDELTYVTESEYEGELGWRGENDLYLFVLKGCVNPINSLSTNEIIHISLQDKAIVGRYGLRAKEGDIICRSSDGVCYTEVSGSSLVTVYFKDAKCILNGVTPLMGHQSLAKWSPDCNHCCFLGKYDDEKLRLIRVSAGSDGKAHMEAWNLGRVPDDVDFEERGGMYYMVPVLDGEKIYKGPFHYDDSIFESRKLVGRSQTEELSETSVSQPVPVSSAPTATADEKHRRRKLRDSFDDVVYIIKFVAIKVLIAFAFAAVALALIWGVASLISLLKK